MKNTLDKRKLERKIIVKTSCIIEIPLPYPKNCRLIKKLHELNEHGASFILSEDEGTLFPGTPLRDVVLSMGDEKIKKDAKVIYSAKIYNGDAFDNRIGIQFMSDLATAKICELNGKKLRPQRYITAKTTKNIVSFIDIDNKEIVGEIVNMSKYGLAFKISASDDYIKKSQLLRDLRVIINNEVIYKGNATVAGLKETNGEIIVGVSISDNILDIQKILAIWKSQNLEENLYSLINDISMDIQVSQEFKAIVADIRYFLENIKRLLDYIEAKLINEPEEDKAIVEKNILENSQKYFKSKMDPLLKELNKIKNQTSLDTEALYKKYFQKNLHYLTEESKFAKRVFEKPWGYPGDYEMVNMIYRNTFEGKTIFQKALHKYDVGIDPAHGHRNRSLYINNVIKELVKKNKSLHIANIGCGPAKEMHTFLELLGKNSKYPAKITLVDFDVRVLELCQEELLDKKLLLNQKNVNFEFIEASIRQVIKKWQKVPPYKQQDLICILGLFDYFSESICRKMVEIFFSHLKKNGRLIISNVTLNNEFKAYMEFSGEWYLNYRNSEIMMELAKNLQNKSNIEIYTEEDDTKTNVYLNILRK
ncbi:MAG: class I SAM-dependent methyltransferase [bacterium]